MDETGAGFSHTVQNAGKGCVQIEKRAQKGKSADIDAGSGIFEKQRAHGFSEHEKSHGTQASKTEAQAACCHSDCPEAILVAECLQLGDRRHKHDGGGIKNRGGKQNQRQSHSCKDPVHAERIG